MFFSLWDLAHARARNLHLLPFLSSCFSSCLLNSVCDSCAYVLSLHPSIHPCSRSPWVHAAQIFIASKCCRLYGSTTIIPTWLRDCMWDNQTCDMSVVHDVSEKALDDIARVHESITEPWSVGAYCLWLRLGLNTSNDIYYNYTVPYHIYSDIWLRFHRLTMETLPFLQGIQFCNWRSISSVNRLSDTECTCCISFHGISTGCTYDCYMISHIKLIACSVRVQKLGKLLAGGNQGAAIFAQNFCNVFLGQLKVACSIWNYDVTWHAACCISNKMQWSSTLWE